MERYTENEKKNIIAIKILPIIVLIAICSLGIGYAALNAINLNITGTLGIAREEGIFITKVVDSSENEIEGFYNDTILNSTIQLDLDDVTSTKTYTITIYNNTRATYKYLYDICDIEDPAFYSNQDIIYTLNDISDQDEIAPHTRKTIEITFKYKDNLEVITNNTLTSCIEFMFEEASINFDLSGTGGGKSFVLGEVEFNANTQTFYTEVDVNTINLSATNENIITIGQYISQWDIPSSMPGAVNLHVFYPSPNDNKIILAPLIQGEKSIQFKMPYPRQMDEGIMKIAFNTNGVYINGKKVIDRYGIGENTEVYGKQNTKTTEEYLDMFFEKWARGGLNVEVGSEEGENRSYAIYNVVKIFKEEMSGAEMINLTTVQRGAELEDITYTEFLLEPYSPGGESFEFHEMFDNLAYNNFAIQTLYTEMYIGGITEGYTERCTQGINSPGKRDNILSVGHEIREWTPLNGTDTVNLHLYYPDDDGNMIVAITIKGNGVKQYIIPMEILNVQNGILKLAFNLNGLYINGIPIITPEGLHTSMTVYQSTGSNINTFIPEFFLKLKTGTLEVGSTQGDNRSNADYYKLRMYDDKLSQNAMIRLTSL